MLAATNSNVQRPAVRIAASASLLALCSVWCLYWFAHAWPYWEDDAWIHLEFARSIAAGHGFAFNGHVVAGDTAPLWVLLLAAIHALIPDWLVAGKTLSALAAIFGFAGIYAVARRLAAQLLAPTTAALFPPAIVLLIAVNPYTCYWIFSGMEPLFAAGLASFAVLAATRDAPTAKSFLAACLLAGMGPLVRPEMTVLAMLLAAPLLGQGRRLKQRAAAKTALVALGIVLLAAPLALWSLYSLHAFGHLLPNTFAAKRAAPGDSILTRLFSIYVSGLPVIPAGLLAGVLYLVQRPADAFGSLRDAISSARRRSLQPARASSAEITAPVKPGRRTLALAGWLFVLWAAIDTLFYIANHTYVQTRYILVTAPGLVVVVLVLALRSWPRAGRWFYALALTQSLAVSLVITVPFLRNKAADCQITRSLALYMHDHLPPDAPVAVYSIGEIAFLSQHPIVDTGGITQPGAIPYLSDPAAMERWERSQGAQYSISSNSPEPGARLVFSVQERFIGWTPHTSLYALSGPVGVWQLPEKRP